MKWKAKKPIKAGTERIVKRFAFFPTTEYVATDNKNVRASGQTVWLEWVYIKQKRIEGVGGELGGISDYWADHEFVTKEQYLDFIHPLSSDNAL